MKRTIFSVAVLVGLFSLTSSATQISYSTSGVFTSTGTSTDGYFTYTGSGASTVTNPFPTAANFGSFTATSKGGTVSDTFTLTVTQTVPSAGSSVLASQSFAGTISTNSSNVILSFAGDGPLYNYPGTNYIGFTIAGVEYALQEYSQLSPSTSNGGLTTLSGLVVGTPEPSALLLGGVGLLALLAGSFRSRKLAVKASQ